MAISGSVLRPDLPFHFLSKIAVQLLASSCESTSGYSRWNRSYRRLAHVQHRLAFIGQICPTICAFRSHLSEGLMKVSRYWPILQATPNGIDIVVMTIDGRRSAMISQQS